MEAGLRQNAQMKQTQTLAPQMRQGLKMLAMSLPELRSELFREMDRNPVIEDVESTLEKETVSDRERRSELEERRDESDYIDDENLPGETYTYDQDALDRRQKFFDSQTKEETLEEHLAHQLKMSEIPEEDHALAEILIGELDDNGFFTGSIPDIVMVSGESERKIRETLKRISELDPPGCGAITIEDCLLAQIDKLDSSPYQDEVRELLEKNLLRVLAEGRADEVMKALGSDEERFPDVLAALRTLEPRPGRAYLRSGKSITYVNPEVHAKKNAEGRWIASVDARSLPDIHISQRYVKMLGDPNVDKETKAFIREKIAAANVIVEAVERRQDTITRIAQAILDAQPGFFENGLKGLKPLTQQEIAAKVGVHHTTVSRTVNDKYISTPKGTVELAKFFTQGFVTESGEQIARTDVLDRLREIVEGEDRAHPYSDEKLSDLMQKAGYKVARRTVAKYRGMLNIPGTAERRK